MTMSLKSRFRYVVLAVMIVMAAICCDAFAANDNVVITDENVVHTFVPSGDKLGAVRSRFETVYRAERADDEVLATKIFGEHQEILKASAPGVKPYYRSWEPEGMFHTGTRICALNVPLKKGKDTKVTFSMQNNWPQQFTGAILSWPYPVKRATVRIEIPAILASRYAVATRNLAAGMELVKTVDGDGDVCYTLTSSDVPAYKTEDGAPAAVGVAPQLFITGHFESVDSLYGYLHSFAADESKDRDAIDALARSITASCSEPVEKIDTIASWVRNNIRYVAVENGEYALKPMAPGEVLAQRYGDCKGSAGLIKAMLKAVDVDGRLVWLGTRDDVPTQWNELPSLQSGNHQIACAVVSDSIIYVDATIPYAPAGYLPWGIRGREAIVENGDGCIVDTIPEFSRSPDKEVLNASFAIDGDNLVGKMSRRYTGHERMAIANIYYGRDVNARQDFLERLLTSPKKNMAAKDARLKLESFSAPECIVSSENVVDNGAVRRAGNRIYVDLRPIRVAGCEAVDTVERKRGLAAKPAEEYEATITLDIPRDCRVDELPEGRTLDNEWYSAEISYELNDVILVAHARLNIRGVAVPRDSLKKYNEAMKALKRLSQSQIVLKYEE